MQRKSLAVGTLFACLSAALLGLAAGCRRHLEPPQPPPHKGAGVRLACPGERTAALIRTHSRRWEARQQARVEVAAYDPAAGPASAGAADVWVIRPAELPHWAAAGRLTPVPEALAARDGAYEWMSLLPLYREQLLVWDGVAYGLPLLGEAQVCVYRSDLFADPELRKAYKLFKAARDERIVKGRGELRAPSTWEQFADLAEFFQGARGKGAPSLPPLPADDLALDRLFYTVAAPHARRAVREEEAAGAGHLDEVFSFHYDLKTGAPRVAGADFRYALSLLGRLQKCRPAGVAARPEEAFRDGRAVLCLAEPSWLVEFQKNPALRDRFGICPMPGADRYFDFRGDAEHRLEEGSNRVPYLGEGGWVAVVPRGAGSAEAAFDLLADLSGPAAGVALEPRWGGGPIRQGQVTRERWDAFDLDGRRTVALREALTRSLLHHRLKNPVVCLRTPDQAPHRAALVAEVRACLAGKKEPKAALAEAARRWEELDRKRGEKRHREEYRISLGLLGK
jgi:multiple sugar transport system substrate-binding protein